MRPGQRSTWIVHPGTRVLLEDEVLEIGDVAAFTFKDQVQNPQGGSLFILQDATIPSNHASVGIAMSGSGAYACQARPNWQSIYNTPHTTYWVAFGTYTQGQVLDINSIWNHQEIQFPANVFSVNARLNEDLTWSVGQS